MTDGSFDAAGTARRSAPWFGLNWLATKALSLGSQLVLGWILLPEEFGIFAIVSGISLLAATFTDGGARQIVLSGGLAKVAKRQPAAFKLSLLTSASGAVVLFLVAPSIARMYGQDELTGMLILLAVSMPLAAPWSIYSARLELQLRFPTYVGIYILRAAIQHGGMVLFALAGWGAMSFVLPLPLVAFVSSLAGKLATGRYRDQDVPADKARSWLRASAWLMLSSAAVGLGAQGDYLGAGLTASAATVGTYYFAFQIPAQALQMASALGNVLLPMLTRLEPSSARAQALIGNAFAASMMILTAVYGLLAVTMPDLELLLWGGRWQQAVVPAQILCVAMPFLGLLALPRTLLLRSERFTASFVLNVAIAFALVAAGIGGGALDDVVALARTVTGGMAIVSLAVLAWTMPRAGVPVKVLLATTLRCGVPAVCAFILSSVLVAAVTIDSGMVRLFVLSIAYTGIWVLTARVAAPTEMAIAFRIVRKERLE